MIIVYSALILSLGTILGITLRTITRYRSYYDELTIKQKRFTIAILIPTINRPPFTSMYSSFVSHLKKYASFEFETLECVAGDMDTIYKWAEYIASSNVDLIYAAGQPCTQTMYRIMKTRSKKIPIISGGVAESMLDVPFKNMIEAVPFTGSYCQLNWLPKLTILKEIYPQLKRVVVLCRSIDEISHVVLREKNSITSALRKLHVSWEMHHISDIKKGTELTKDILSSTDLVLIPLSSSEIIAHTAIIAEECEKYNIPVFSTDLNNPHIFMGISEPIERLFGTYCAQQAIKILEDGKKASQLEMRHIKGDNSIVIRPQNAAPLTAVTVIGHLLEKSPHVRMVIQNKNDN